MTQISVEDAEEYTQSLGQILGGSWRQIALAERMGVPGALGLSTQDWVQQRLGGYTRLSVSERREAARELTAPPDEGGHGMSQREAADVLGVSPGTVNHDLKPAPVQNQTPDPQPVDDDDDDGASSLVEEGFTWDEPDVSEPDDAPVQNQTPDPQPVKPLAHVGRNSGDNEWYTPREYIKAAATVMGGIDLDPASSETANEVVAAARIWTAEDDGLTQPWSGRVWLNPPYAQPLVDRFCGRIAREYHEGNITEACVLVNNATETNWFHAVAAQASAMCFPRGRVRFWKPDSDKAAPLQGQAILYLGHNPGAFRAEFLRFGFVVTL